MSDSVASLRSPPAASAAGPLWLGYSLALLITCVWTGWILVSRFGVNQTLTVFDVTALRWGVGGTLVLPLALYWGLRGVRPLQALVLLICFGPPYALIFYVGFQHAPAAHGGVLVNGLLPFITLVIGAALLGDRASRSRLFGIGLILLGSLCIGGDGLLLAPPGTWIGDLLFLATATLLGCYMLAVRAWNVGPQQVLAIVLVGGMLLYMPFYLLLPVPSTLQSLPIADWPWDEVLLQGGYQGLMVSLVGVTCFTLATRILGSSVMAAFMAGVPAFAMLAAWPILAERPSILALTGGLVVTGGILFASGLLPWRSGRG